MKYALHHVFAGFLLGMFAMGGIMMWVSPKTSKPYVDPEAIVQREAVPRMTGVEMYTDPDNGCQYLVYRWNSGVTMTPRLNAADHIMCEPDYPRRPPPAKSSGTVVAPRVHPVL